MLKARMMLLIPLLAMQGCGLFVAGKPIVTTQSAGCSSLIPEEWKQRVAGPDLPDGNIVGDWQAFADAVTGKLDIANDRTVSSIGIVERCEARDAEAVKRATRRTFLGL